MYLSRVEIDISNRQKLHDLTHLGRYHSWVENSFPNEVKKGIRSRHLWRIDYLNGKQYLLVVSADKPDLRLLSKYGIGNTAETKDYDPFISSLKIGKEYRFRLTANPTVKITKKGEKQGKVYPHVTVKQQKDWLVKRMKDHGFLIPKINDNFQFDIVSREYKILYHNRKRIRLSCVTFEGILEITDLSIFKDSLTKGIGREKAYGMGMLTVIPVD